MHPPVLLTGPFVALENPAETDVPADFDERANAAFAPRIVVIGLLSLLAVLLAISIAATFYLRRRRGWLFGWRESVARPPPQVAPPSRDER